MTSLFRYASQIHQDFPQLSFRFLTVQGLSAQADTTAVVSRFMAQAAQRLSTVSSESDFPEIQAWRRAFAHMGLKPTQYRCAAEALLRRYRLHGNFPRLHPLIDLANAVSMAYAIPVAVFDMDKIVGGMQLRAALGNEFYQSFAAGQEHPEPGELIFVDEAGQAHARRWTHRQSAYSAINTGTTRVLIIAEALHPNGQQDVAQLQAALRQALAQCWPACVIDPGPDHES